jgi:hypothetical protein
MKKERPISVRTDSTWGLGRARRVRRLSNNETKAYPPIGRYVAVKGTQILQTGRGRASIDSKWSEFLKKLRPRGLEGQAVSLFLLTKKIDLQ